MVLFGDTQWCSHYLLKLDFRSKEGHDVKKKIGLNAKTIRQKALQQIKSSTAKRIIAVPVRRKKKRRLLDYQTLSNIHGQYTELSFVQLKKTLRHYRLDIQGSHLQLGERLYHFLHVLQYYSSQKSSIIYIQQWWKKKHAYYLCHLQRIQQWWKNWRLYYYHRLRGPAFRNRIISNNTEDFYSCESIQKIPDRYFFSFREQEHVYSFDLRSLYKWTTMNQDVVNPYTRKSLSPHVCDVFQKLIFYLNSIKYPLLMQEDILSKEQIFQNRVVKVFQEMDALDNYTDIDWFYDMELPQLRQFYKSAEDIWNYRAELTSEIKSQIIPNWSSKHPFSVLVKNIHHIDSKRRMQHIVLSVMESFITQGISRDNCIVGAMYMLTALVEVSPAAANSLPWLVQVSG